MEIVIRPARADDAEAIVAILNPIIEAGVYTVLDTPLTAGDEREYIVSFPRTGVLHVAESLPDRRLVGLQDVEPFATYTRALAHVGTIGTFVDLACWHQRIGSRLAEATMAAARRQGYSKLFTYVRADNPAALAFYRQLGFRVVGTAERQARIAGRYIDEVVIERLL